MTLLVLLLIYELLISLVSSSSTLSLYLHEPRPNQIYPIQSIGALTHNINLRYQVFGNSNNDIIDVCFELFLENRQYIRLTCFKYDEASAISLDNLIPGSYVIHLFLKSNGIIIDLSLIHISEPTRPY